MPKTSVENSEELVENNLRPMLLKDFYGQDSLKENLLIYIQAAKKRNEALDHVLFYGPAGLGKTTLANIIAHELNQNIVHVSGPTIERIGDMAAILSSLEAGDILFIDEIHRLPKVVEEFLYQAMEDFEISFVISKEKDADNIHLKLPPFTIVGATTKISLLSWPMRTRFGITFHLDFYKVEDIKKIIMRSANIFGEKIDEESALEIAIRSRGTPRIANRILRRVRDFSSYRRKTPINKTVTLNALEKLKIDQIGLDELDIIYLETLINRFDGGPVGIETMSATIGEDVSTLEEVCEPYLLSIGFINRTRKGREISSDGRTYFLKYHQKNESTK